ncbi:MAG: hypothetical protein R3F11_15850 [Verrucomicrobiales bacterium]
MKSRHQPPHRISPAFPNDSSAQVSCFMVAAALAEKPARFLGGHLAKREGSAAHRARRRTIEEEFDGEFVVNKAGDGGGAEVALAWARPKSWRSGAPLGRWRW